MEDSLKISDKPPVYLVELPRDEEEVYVTVALQAGKIFEDDSIREAAHLFEHYAAGLVGEQCDVLNSWASTSMERIEFGAVFHRKKFREEFEKYMSILFHTDFSHQDIFEYEKKSAYNEIIERENSVHFRYVRAFAKELFKKSEYENNYKSRIDHTHRVTLEKIKIYYQQCFLKVEPLIVIGGYKIQESFKEDVQRIVEKYSSKDGYPYFQTSFPTVKREPFFIQEIMDPGILQGVYIVFNFPAPYIKNGNIADKAHFSYLLNILGNDQGFCLVKNVKKEGVHMTNIEKVTLQKYADVSIEHFCSYEQVFKVIQIVHNTIESARNEFVREDEIERGKKDAVRAVDSAWGHNYRKYRWIMEDVLENDSFLDKKQGLELIQKMTAQDIQNVAKEYLDFEKLNLFLIHGGKEVIDTKKIETIFRKG